MDTKLVKHLISLRIHLSTANLAWINEFVEEETGLQVLGSVLARLVSKGGKRKVLSDVEESVLLELIKCLRVLLNTEVWTHFYLREIQFELLLQAGFEQVLSSPTIVTHIAYSLHHSSFKLRSLVSDLLAAICVLSLPDGHKAVLAAMSDYRIAFDEAFRFEDLISSLRLSLTDTDSSGSDLAFDRRTEDNGAWEARTASMVLVNALTNCPESLEERIFLREEFGRRGLNEVIVVSAKKEVSVRQLLMFHVQTLRYIKPPDMMVTQLDVYTEEKFEDEEDMRERVVSLMERGHERSISDSEAAVEELVSLSKQHVDVHPKIVDILKDYAVILKREMDV